MYDCSLSNLPITFRQIYAINLGIEFNPCNFQTLQSLIDFRAKNCFEKLKTDNCAGYQARIQ